MGNPRSVVACDLAPPFAAPQQSRGPRPLPLFLELLRQAALHDPELAKEALQGVRRYQSASPRPTRGERPVLHAVEGSSLRDCGGEGPTVLLVPSLINPPTILDLDRDCSLADVLARKHRVLLLDWGPAAKRGQLDLDRHVTERLLPLMRLAGSSSLVGYCLGGTLALSAAARCQQVQSVATLASPWAFGFYGAEARRQLSALWKGSEAACNQLGFLPMEILQAAFWQLDPDRLLAKFARFAAIDPASSAARRFVTLEEWANAGEPLPLPAARQLVEDLFDAGGTLGRLPRCPMLHITASNDRIAPSTTAAQAGELIAARSGHVGMIVGRNAATELHAPLLSWLDGRAAGG